MTRTIRLRPWQKAAFDAFVASTSPDFLAVATPGRRQDDVRPRRGPPRAGRAPGRLIVVAPTAHLKVQWADARPTASPSTSTRRGRRPTAARRRPARRRHHLPAGGVGRRRAARPGRATPFVILDELHHAADDRAWGDSIRVAFGGARRRLALSGTPFRSDTSAIPFVDYVLDEARPDYEYGYGEALRDGRVVRPVYFPRTGGEMEWVAPDGREMAASFDDALDAARSAQRLRTALSLDGQWLPTVLRSAHDRLDRAARRRPRRRRPGHRHRPGPRPRHRRA